MLVVLVSMAGVWLEKQTLEMRRTVSVQYYQTDVLLDLLVRQRLETQQLTAPAHLVVTQEVEKRVSKQQPATERRKSRVAAHRDEPSEPEPSGSSGRRLPLLRFQHPFNPEGID